MATSPFNVLDTVLGDRVLGAAAVAGLLSDTPQPLVGSTLKSDTGTKTAAATSGAATLNKSAGVVTSEALVTAAGGVYTLTLTDNQIAAADQLLVSVGNGTNSAGQPTVAAVTPGAGSATIVIQNIHASAAFNGTLKIAFVIFKN